VGAEARPDDDVGAGVRAVKDHLVAVEDQQLIDRDLICGFAGPDGAMHSGEDIIQRSTSALRVLVDG